jgi:thioredoxin 1
VLQEVAFAYLEPKETVYRIPWRQGPRLFVVTEDQYDRCAEQCIKDNSTSAVKELTMTGSCKSYAVELNFVDNVSGSFEYRQYPGRQKRKDRAFGGEILGALRLCHLTKHKIPLSASLGMESKTDSISYVTTKTWDAEVLGSNLPVFVDFWAEWCGPCKMVGPAVEQIGNIMAGKVKVAKLNVDENQQIAMKYGVQSIPSLILFKGGKEVARTIGAAPKETYIKFIESSLKA